MLGTLVEIPAAILVVAEVVILFAGVIARYVLHQPLIWSDELASMLFLWLAMFGAAVAFRRVRAHADDRRDRQLASSRFAPISTWSRPARRWPFCC